MKYITTTVYVFYKKKSTLTLIKERNLNANEFTEHCK